MLKVSRGYVGDSTPVVQFATSFPVKSVRIGVGKKQPKNNKEKQKKQRKKKGKKKQK